MWAKNFRLAVSIVLISALALVIPCQSAFAARHGGGGPGWGGGAKHYYNNGHWYRHGWFGLDVAVSALAIGALIDSLPPRTTNVVVEGTPYYYCDNYYYRPSPYGGYVVVQPPVVAQPTVVVPQAPELVTINIPNIRGGYTVVTLRRSGAGYIGPQGEYYPGNPTVEQLKVLYGRS